MMKKNKSLRYVSHPDLIDQFIYILLHACIRTYIYSYFNQLVFQTVDMATAEASMIDPSMPKIKLDHPMMMISRYQKLFQTVQPDWPVEAPTCQPLVGRRRTQ